MCTRRSMEWLPSAYEETKDIAVQRVRWNGWPFPRRRRVTSSCAACTGAGSFASTAATSTTSRCISTTATKPMPRRWRTGKSRQFRWKNYRLCSVPNLRCVRPSFLFIVHTCCDCAVVHSVSPGDQFLLCCYYSLIEFFFQGFSTPICIAN